MAGLMDLLLPKKLTGPGLLGVLAAGAAPTNNDIADKLKAMGAPGVDLARDLSNPAANLHGARQQVPEAAGMIGDLLAAIGGAGSITNAARDQGPSVFGGSMPVTRNSQAEQFGADTRHAIAPFINTEDPTKPFLPQETQQALGGGMRDEIRERGALGVVDAQDVAGAFGGAKVAKSFIDMANNVPTPKMKGRQVLGRPAKKSEQVKTGDVISGLTTRDGIPNLGSISSSFDNSQELGIHEVPMRFFSNTKFANVKENDRARALAKEIGVSKEISPLIVAIDAEGPYILEGGHRLQALQELGVDSFPALVVKDLDDGDFKHELLDLVQNPPTPKTSGRQLMGRPAKSRAGNLAEELKGQVDPSVIAALLRADSPVPMEMRPKSAIEARSLVTKASKENPAVARREELRANGETIIEDQIDIPSKVIEPEELVGSVGVPLVSDRSRADGRLTQIAGAPLTMDVFLQGGIDFPKLNGAAWASMFDTATGKQSNIRKASEAHPGKRVLGVTTMMGHEAINFSTPIIEGMIGQLDAIDLPRSALKKFDDHVNAILRADGKPEFLGLQHPEALDQLIGRGDFDKLGAGALRKTLIKEMAKVDFRNIGFPVHRDVVNAVTRPDLKRAHIGEGGLTIVDTDPGGKVIQSPIHNSYNGLIPGRYFGGLAESLPPDILFPKTFEKLAKSWTNPDWKKDSKGRKRGLLEGPKRAPLTDSQRTGSLVSAHLWEEFDQEWLDGVMQYMEKIKSARGNEVLAAIVLGAGVFEGLEGDE